MIYQGSKARLAKYINPIINKIIKENNIYTFVDACCGGCNIIANPKYPIKAKELLAYDNNKYLIALLNKFKYNKPNLFEMGRITKEDYERTKDKVINNKEVTEWYAGFVGFFTTFGAGFFNGFVNEEVTKRNRVELCYNNIIKQNFSEIDIVNKDVFDINIKNALIYIDPPYTNTKKYKTNFDYQKFWDKTKELAKDNIVLVSEQTLPQNIDYEILFEKELKMTMNRHGSYRTRKEYLIKINGDNR
mgnify:CR=1 FL=1